MSRIYVQAKTNARVDEITKIDEIHYQVKTRELPLAGRANLAIIELLAEYFNVPKSTIQIHSGFSSKQKVFEMSDL